MKKVFSIFMLLICAFVVFGVVNSPIDFVCAEGEESEEIEYVKVITNTTKLYTHPDSTKTEEENPSFVLNFETELKVLEKSVAGADGVTYIKVEYKDKQGYVVSSHVINVKDESLKKQLDANAKINKDDAELFDFDGTNYVKMEGVVLNKETKVKLVNGYDKSQKYLKAIVEISNHDEVVGYIKIEDISVSGISLETIIAISIFAVCLIFGGILIYRVIRKKMAEEK